MSNISHLNIFNFYDGQDKSTLRNENNLTRAFLVLLKNSPFLFHQFIDLVKTKMEMDIDTFNKISDVLFFTQKGSDLSDHACEVIVPVIITEKEINITPYEQVNTPSRNDQRNIADGVESFGFFRAVLHCVPEGKSLFVFLDRLS